MALKREVTISLLNGIIFGLLIAVIAYLWFDTWMLGVVIALSMFINLIAAGFFGAAIPLLLKQLDIDPAVGSTVLLTTITDIFGFFSFLWLAKVMLL
jgi:magnesium transporter